MRLTRLDIESLPGLDGRFTLEPAPGINVVVGPNASGKSSLARAVHGLLWPRNTPGAARQFLAATFVDAGGERVAVRRPDGAFEWLRGGQPTTAPRLPDDHLRSRYELGLTDLVEQRGPGRDRAFAAEIRRQMTGGVDLDLAGNDLFHASAVLASRRLKEWRQAALARDEQERHQRDLHERQRGLDAWRTELAAAAAQGLDAEALRAALAVLDARDILATATAQLTAFPPALAAFRPEDPQAQQSALQRLAEAEAELAACTRRLNEAVARRQALGPVPPFPPAVDSLVEAWRQAAGWLESAAVDLAGAHSQREEAAARLRGAAAEGTSAAGSPDRESLARLARLFVDAEEARARLNAADALLSERLIADGRSGSPQGSASNTGTTPDSGATTTTDTAAAVAALESWLVSRPASLWWPLAAVVAGAALLTAAALARAGGIAPLPLLVGVALIAAGTVGTVGALRARNRHSRRTDAARHALTATGMGEAERAVAAADTVAALAARDRLKEAGTRRELVAAWRDRLLAERERAHARLRELETEATKLRHECGLGAELSGRGVLHDAEAAARLREADGNVARAMAEHAKRASNEAERALRVQEVLAAAGEQSAADPAAAAATVRRWQQRLDDQTTGDRDVEGLREQLAEATRRRGSAADELVRLRARLGLAADGSGDAELAALAGAHAGWLQAVAARDTARASLTARTEAADPELLAHPREALQARLDAAGDAPARERDLLQRITALETELAATGAERRLEVALSNLERARDKLAEEHVAARRAALAEWLLAGLRTEEASTARPVVLENATALLRRFTQGRHRLELTSGQGGEPTFAAVDETLGRRQSLAELSDGTRVQLLLAVRLAFITAMEGDEPLPLFLDEALTSTDPGRFAAVAAALGELAREQGRQVFYLTSQPGDAAAWDRALVERGLPPAKLIDLARARRLAGAATTAQLAPPPPADLPAPEPGPEGLAAWRRDIGVPPFDPRNEAGAQHIDWLLVDDGPLLHRLVVSGAARVGPLLASADDLIDAGVLDEATATRLRERARAMASFLAHWRVGRGHAVTPDDIDNSKAVTTAMRGPVLELLERVNGDAVAFAAQLADVKRLQERKAEQLLQHLRETGALDERATFDREAVLVRVLGDLGRTVDLARTGDPTQARLNVAEIRACVARWWEAASAAKG
ncbi:MAG: AAA family ATPase [bacterium]|nr:AAA family ATPase [bacterium]